MSDIIDVNMGDLVISSAPNILTTSSIGSCVAVCLYSPIDKIGSLAHIMLPERPETELMVTDADNKYANIAIAVMTTSLEKNGVSRSKLIAKIAGGANMFPAVQGRSHKIGEKNVESVRNILTSYGIRLAAEDVGGSTGRSLQFDLGNGIVTIKVTI